MCKRLSKHNKDYRLEFIDGLAAWEIWNWALLSCVYICVNSSWQIPFCGMRSYLECVLLESPWFGPLQALADSSVSTDVGGGMASAATQGETKEAAAALQSAVRTGTMDALLTDESAAGWDNDISFHARSLNFMNFLVCNPCLQDSIPDWYDIRHFVIKHFVRALLEALVSNHD